MRTSLNAPFDTKALESCWSKDEPLQIVICKLDNGNFDACIRSLSDWHGSPVQGVEFSNKKKLIAEVNAMATHPRVKGVRGYGMSNKVVPKEITLTRLTRRVLTEMGVK